MNQNKRLVLSSLSRIFITLLILAVLGLQFLEECHVHSDGVDHSDCPLCLLSGIIQSPNINHVLLEKPLQYSQKIFPIIDSFICIYFRGFLYTPCGPPQA
ncbi:MAG: hypothetical protein L6428_01250 [Candidatus Aminicenantes bacterium]|nr:hypothetical protein [Candidatus Aminicenantes bacterium]